MSCFSMSQTDAEKRNNALERELKLANKNARAEHKILLLGPGESGKSTIFKQMKIIQENGCYTQEELMSFRRDIFSNTVLQMRVLLRGAANGNFHFESEAHVVAAGQLLQDSTQGVEWSAEIGKLVKTVWSDPKLQHLYTNHDDRKFQTNDTAHYFFNAVDRLIAPDYCPTVSDVLHVRVRSTGIQEATFKFAEVTFKVVDVGGQRSERRKWIHCFDAVTCVIFCASLSDYDQGLREEKTVNRLDEAIELFDDVFNSHCFPRSAVVLFLNKIDLFKEKIKRVPLSTRFPAYEGGDDFEKGAKFIEARFTEVANDGVKPIVFTTCAIDTENIKLVITAVKMQILKNFTNQFIL